MLLLAAVGIARAADAVPTATDADKSYLAIRNSKDRKTQLLAERWYGLVQLQEWSDASGQFKTKAKYVEQDDKQGTVKLRVIKGAGKDQVVKDKTIQVDKLSKECQARVKQIAFLADKVDEAAKAEAEKAAKPKDGQDAMAGMAASPPDDRGGRAARGKADRGGANDRAKAAADQQPPANRDVPADSRVPQREQAGEAATALPAAMPPLPVAAAASSEPPATAAPIAAENDRRGGPRSLQPANLPDQQPWRTSFDAFRANLTATRTDSGWQLSWGELTAIQQAHDEAIAAATGPRARELAGSPPPSYDSLGEFTWESPLSQQPDEQTDWSKALGLSLVEPFRLSCELDQERGPGDWRRFFPGDRVKFIGRIISFAGDSEIHIAIRFPDEGPAAAPVRPYERR